MTDDPLMDAMERAMAGDAAPPEPGAVEARARDLHATYSRVSWRDRKWEHVAAVSLVHERSAVAAERARCVAILRRAIEEIEGTTP